MKHNKNTQPGVVPEIKRSLTPTALNPFEDVFKRVNVPWYHTQAEQFSINLFAERMLAKAADKP